ncbi:T9SS-dependent choice-of-anchor J family protein [Fulvivirga sediminis]|nr:choice-of-anchor J domain-containing protein [Fulvivirga sediminis]
MTSPNPTKEKVEFEEWMSKKVISLREAKNSSQGRQMAEIITIPVVVHVIHNGSALGEKGNITDEQIISQIDVLNEDYRRRNADAANTPSVFQSVAADTEIQFALAKRDPEGLPTNGIVRVNGHQKEWFTGENVALKRLSYWPAEDYLNIWVTDIEGNFLGYAQFPDSGLSGIENESTDRATDGVVIDYLAFGSKDKHPTSSLAGNYDLGRTATHEIGHYLGLRHIWGDNTSCSGTDYVSDTPTQQNSTNSCPSGVLESCGSRDMYENYMDYTSDACMNLFTKGQKERIRIVMENSPRRASLKNSLGLVEPVIVSNNLGIRKIITPETADCADTSVPTLEIRNYGNNTITSAKISLKVNGSVVETRTYGINLAPLAMTTVSFSTYTYGFPGTYNFEFEITQVNGLSDNDNSNNIAEILVTKPEEAELPFNIDFNTFPANWTIENPDEHITWQLVNAPKETSSNRALGIDFFNYENGAVDILKSPSIDISESPVAVLKFAVAYGGLSKSGKEGLLVTVNPYCGDAIDNADTVYYKVGNDLKSYDKFDPTNASDWKYEAVDLEAYRGQKISISFIAINANGSRLYIDDIEFDDTKKTDIALEYIVSPAPVACSTSDLEFIVRNQGTEAIASFDWQYILDNDEVQNFHWVMTNNDSLLPNATKVMYQDLPGLSKGEHSLEILVKNPNEELDNNPLNSSKNLTFYIDGSYDYIPIKENFETFEESLWLITSESKNTNTWTIDSLDNNIALRLKATNNEPNKTEGWLTSPALIFEGFNTAHLSFDLAASYSENDGSLVTVLGSTDCGTTYEDILLSVSYNDLINGGFSGAPDKDNWQTFNINLNQYLGQQGVRLAFVSSGKQGSNVYLDDINIFVTDQHIKGVHKPYPNPSRGTFYQPFDLDYKQKVDIIIYSTNGKIMAEKSFDNTLNQTYTIDLSSFSSGIYLIKVKSESFTDINRIMIQR